MLRKAGRETRPSICLSPVAAVTLEPVNVTNRTGNPDSADGDERAAVLRCTVFVVPIASAFLPETRKPAVLSPPISRLSPRTRFEVNRVVLEARLSPLISPLSPGA